MHNLTLPTLTESIACFRTQKLPKIQVSLKITVVGESFKRKTIIVSAASGTFECTWNISKRGRKDENILKRERLFKILSNNYKAYRPFAHERTIQFNLDVATSRRTHKHENIVLLFARANEGDGWKPTSDHLPCYYVFTHKDQIRNRIIAGRIISAHHSENTFRNVVDLRFRCLTAIFFLLELRKSIIYTSGGSIRHIGHSFAMEHLLLLARI